MTDSRKHPRLNNHTLVDSLSTMNNQMVTHRGDDIHVKIRMAPHGRFVDQGTKGTKSTYPASSSSPFTQTKGPPHAKMKRWMNGKGMLEGLTEKQVLKRVKRLQHLIKERGVEAVPFFSTVVNDNFYRDLFYKLEQRGAEGIRNEFGEFIIRESIRIMRGADGKLTLHLRK